MLFGRRPRVVLEFPSLVANLVAAGGLLGALSGLVRELRRQYSRVDELNRRNRVLNRLLRHDIRNDVDVIRGYVDLIDDRTEGIEELVAPVRRKSREIVETSEAARQVQSLEATAEEGPVDVVALARERVDILRDTHPGAEIVTDLPEEAWADAGDLLGAVLDNLVGNAVEHADRSVRVAVEVETGGDAVVLRVADNGPGLPESRRRALSTAPGADAPGEAGGDAGAGLGLHLVKWFVDSYDGRLSFEGNDPRGTVARVELPAARAPEPVPAD